MLTWGHLKLNFPQNHICPFSVLPICYSPRYMQQSNLSEVIGIYIGQATGLYVSIIMHCNQPADELRMLSYYKHIYPYEKV